jgi:hypothetical protein
VEVSRNRTAPELVSAALPGRDKTESWKAGWDYELLDIHGRVFEKIVKAREVARLTRQRKPHGTLRVGVDEQGFPPTASEGIG